jgi:hypothetical protein
MGEGRKFEVPTFSERGGAAILAADISGFPKKNKILNDLNGAGSALTRLSGFRSSRPDW